MDENIYNIVRENVSKDVKKAVEKRVAEEIKKTGAAQIGQENIDLLSSYFNKNLSFNAEVDRYQAEGYFILGALAAIGILPHFNPTSERKAMIELMGKNPNLRAKLIASAERSFLTWLSIEPRTHEMISRYSTQILFDSLDFSFGIAKANKKED